MEHPKPFNDSMFAPNTKPMLSTPQSTAFFKEQRSVLFHNSSASCCWILPSLPSRWHSSLSSEKFSTSSEKTTSASNSARRRDEFACRLSSTLVCNMVLLSDWQAFVLAVRDMFLHSPNTTRYTMKYKRQSAELTLKVTDNVTCLKYRATNPAELKNVERLGHAFMQWTLQPSSASKNLPFDFLPSGTSESAPSQREGKPRRRRRGA
ncbi:signal recognition particle (SRP9) domain-containing protein [Toxoplasma gondii VEG]|uniref:Signal recognition particle (SRP9) domain-containing protein n=1 Tax=Toxoplasma gondii (strain ATCC 50861 / VEG) TaxID=432359 RepID=V5B5F1_TOXGV|nr:signal recognition particle (SRP9) domain-containing protein [Toxoplasma gondii VEG]